MDEVQINVIIRDMKQLREVIDYANVPYYQKPAFYILVVIFVVCVITFFNI